MDVHWMHQFSCVVAGHSGCGKTEWFRRFLSHLPDMTHPVPTQIIWSYGEWQPTYHSLQNKVQFVQGWPELPIYSQDPFLLIINDQMCSVDQRVTSLFTKGCHHRNIIIIYIVQNLFDQHKEHRTISLNAHYLVVFKNPRDGSQIVHLAKQMYPGKNNYMRHAFELATRYPHGYLLIDLKQSTPVGLRLRSHIFPGESKEVYVEDHQGLYIMQNMNHDSHLSVGC